MRDDLLVMDIGMFDGVDSEYYLAKGFRVVAIDANPALIDLARTRFWEAIAARRLILKNVAIGETEGTSLLHLANGDLGSSSIYPERVGCRISRETVAIRTVPFSRLLETYGTPYYLKCDIEGADRFCILALERAHRPTYVSFEMGDDALALLGHLTNLGYEKFKIINQVNFRELAYIHSFAHRVARRVQRLAGLGEAPYVRRDGWRFQRPNSSGPMGDATAGAWRSYEQTSKRWTEFCTRFPPQHRAGWYDLHAKLD